MSNRVELFDLQPVLHGTDVSLRPLHADDFEALYAVASDPKIWIQHPANDRYEYRVFRAFFDEAIASGGALIATDVATQAVIGSSRYHGYDAERSEIEIGWTFLARSYWGGRYNGEMKQLMLRHAFRYVEHVLFMIGTTNIRSQRAIEKIGGVRIGLRADPGGSDSYVYRISAPRDGDG
ncbi:MAG: GNAT family N-acetyltransferase [Pseudomonadota bacterium]